MSYFFLVIARPRSSPCAMPPSPNLSCPDERVSRRPRSPTEIDWHLQRRQRELPPMVSLSKRLKESSSTRVSGRGIGGPGRVGGRGGRGRSGGSGARRRLRFLRHRQLRQQGSPCGPLRPAPNAKVVIFGAQGQGKRGDRLQESVGDRVLTKQPHHRSSELDREPV